MKIACVPLWCLFVGFLCNAPGNVWSAEIGWKVENRFLVFKDAKDFQNLEAAFAAGTASDFLAANRSAQELTNLFPIERTAWDANTGTYDRAVLFRAEHQILFSLTGIAPVGTCEWHINSRTQVAPCSGTSAGISERTPISVQVTQNGAVVAAMVAPAGIQTKFIIGVGDSFASGEGNPDHPAILRSPEPLAENWFGKNPRAVIAKSAAWWDLACHRSLMSWQAMYALRQAIADPQRVVRFASFACSGAEVYDGFLNAQIGPPGLGKTGRLALSQQAALMSLLCNNGAISRTRHLGMREIDGPRRKQRLFGEYDLAKCAYSGSTVDELLLSFGGNDVGFSGVVKWGLGVPDIYNNKGGIFVPLRILGLRVVNKFVDPVAPQKAAASLQYIPQLYVDLEQGLVSAKGPASRVIALIYPDPMPSKDFKTCQQRTRDGNHPLALKINNSFSDFKFGLPELAAKQIRSAFIDPLRAIQSTTIREMGSGWSGIDANDGINIPNQNPRTICGNPPGCAEGKCDPANRLTWASKATNFSGIPRLSSLLDYLPYDPSRVRGIRSASDALLTQSVLSTAMSSKGILENKLNDDWIFGMAHPTAAVHATIADRLFERNANEPPQ